MCTLTILRKSGCIVVTMNRDERKSRPEPALIHSETVGDLELSFPLDQQSKGTWFGFNNAGLVGCLLNRYQFKHEEDRQSRGGLIPEALQCVTPAEAIERIAKKGLSGFNPFDLFLIDHEESWRLQWDGGLHDASAQQVRLEPDVKQYMFSSSSLKTEEVLSYRQALFNRWKGGVGCEYEEAAVTAESVLHNFHLAQDARYKTHAVLMEREFSHTKSVCQLNLNSAGSDFSYYPDVLRVGLQKRQDKTFVSA